MTHVRVWKFRPRQGRQSEFATAYASDGVWSKLFSKACGYRGTVLLSPGDISLEGVAGNEEFVGVFEDNELPRAR